VTIYTASGALVQEDWASAVSLNGWKAARLESGLYFVNIRIQGGSVFSHRILIQ